MSDAPWTRLLQARGPGEEYVSDPLPPISDSVQAESDAQTRLIQHNIRRIFLLIYRIVGNVDDAQDLTQETFIKALQRQSQLKDLEKAGHWLSRIAANTAIVEFTGGACGVFIELVRWGSSERQQAQLTVHRAPPLSAARCTSRGCRSCPTGRD